MCSAVPWEGRILGLKFEQGAKAGQPMVCFPGLPLLHHHVGTPACAAIHRCSGSAELLCLALGVLQLQSVMG